MTNQLTTPSQKQQQQQHYDVVIVGAGPAALATLSALQESFSLDQLTDPQRNQILSSLSLSSRRTKSTKSKKRVCVVDPSGKWMAAWKENFDTLEIQFLRSPVLAHPDAFDEHALLAYCVSHHNYYRCQDELLASGCSDVTRLKGLGEAYNGLWHMPSSRLFADFCDHLTQTLPHDFVQDSVVDIQKVLGSPNNEEATYRLSFANQSPRITAKSIVLATGAVGVPTFPKSLLHVPKDRLLHWKRDLNTSHGPSKGIPSTWKNILVVGGGLTAVQVAQLALRHGSSNDRKVILCSRRPLVEKHLDIGLDWVDRRRAQKCQSDFYHRPMDERFQILREARGGGSVPPYYMRQVEQLEAQGRLQRLVGNPNLISLENLLFGDKSPSSPFQVDQRGEACQCCRRDSPLVIGIGTQIHRFDGVLVACGIQPDCTQNALFANLVQTMEREGESSCKVYQGLPVVTEDLEWCSNMFVVGAMAGLNLGPDAGNLMGARRGASLIANALDCRAWLRTTGNIFANRYSVFDDDDESSSSDASSEDDDDSD